MLGDSKGFVLVHAASLVNAPTEDCDKYANCGSNVAESSKYTTSLLNLFLFTIVFYLGQKKQQYIWK